MKTGPWIGNDVVDLLEPEARGKSADVRFMRRVFSESEFERIQGAADRDRELWSLWAAKESAYKIAKKIRPDGAFPPRTLRVVESGEGDQVEIAELGLYVSIRFDSPGDPGFVHCIATVSPVAPALRPAHRVDHRVEKIDRLLGDRSSDVSLSDESRAVRVLAGRLLKEAGFPDAVVSRPIEGGSLSYPRVKEPTHVSESIDLSLSHHGRFAAVALAVPQVVIS